MRKTGMRLLAVLLAVVMVLPSVLIPGMAAEATGFTDVPEGSWYEDAVNYVSEKGYMTGVGDNKFAPNDEVTRAMFVTILARITMAETDGTASAFTDVPANKWYTGAVNWAAEKGIVNGVGDGMFAPGKSITRQDLCTILYRFVNAMDYELTVGEEKTFTDSASVSSYAAEAVRYASSVGLIAGYDDGTFRPKATATRAQMAVIIMRLARLLDGQIVKPEPMPAQSFNGAAGDDMTVSVNAPKGALPENTNMTVSRVTDEAALAAIAEKSGAEIFAAADITFSKNGAELEPEKAVEVQIAMDGIEDLKNPVVYHVLADGNLEYISSEVIPAIRGSGKVLRFYADEFTVYAVGDNTNTVNTLTVNFYEKDGTTIISSQVIRLDQLDEYIEKGMEFVHDPGVPAITDTQSFEGWADKQVYTEEDTGYSVADINEKIETEKATLAAATTDQTWDYYAKVYNVVFVTFHDQGGVVIRLESIHLDENTNEGEYEVNLSYSPFKGGWAHIGWTRTINNTGDEPTYPADLVYYENGDTITLTQSIDLYPYLKQGYWLIFDNNIDQDQDDTSASFTSPKYYGKDESAALPTDYGDANNDGVDHDTEPYRVGYTFGGWYTDKSFNTPYTARQLTADTTVYAKWSPRTDTPYMVVIWTQRADDPVDANDLNNNYDFYKAIETRKGTTGATANFLTADTTLGGATGSELGYYFTYNQAASDTAGKPIKGDGTTVLNVYYDRRQVTVSFNDLTYTSRGSTSTNPTLTSSDSASSRGSSPVYFVSDGSDYYPIRYFSNSETVVYTTTTDDSSTTSSQYAVIRGKWYPLSYSSSGYNSQGAGWYYNDTSLGNCKWNGTRYKYYAYDAVSTIKGYTWYTQTYTPDSTIANNPRTGLYGSSMDDWPSPGSGNKWYYDDEEDGQHWGLSPYDQFAIPDAKNTTVWTIYRVATTATSPKTVHWMLEKKDSDSFEQKTTSELGTSTSQNYNNEKFLGFHAYGHNITGTNSDVYNPTSVVSYTTGIYFGYSNISGSDAYIYYKRNTFDLTFISNNVEIDVKRNIKYGADISAYADITPTNGPAGYYFDGWYKDPGFEEEFDWTGSMPNNNVAVYAKWTKMRFRVTLDYTGGDSSAQVTFPANQASTFRVYYGEKVRDTAIQAATREGYTLLGWYLDPNGEHPFNFAEAITDQTYNMDFSYVYGTSRSGTDAVTGDSYNDDELDDNGNPKYADVIGKVTIYALWRQNSVGSDGVRVRYDAIENDGYFPVDGQATDPRVIIRDDPNIYTDHAKAFTQVASTPEDQDNYRFLYWVVMQPVKDSSGNVILNEDGTPKLEQTNIKVYPGQTFTVDYDYTVQVEAVKVKWIFKDADGDEDLTDTTTVTKGAVPTHSKPSGYVSGSYYYPVVGWTDGTTTYYYDGDNHTGTNIELHAVSENTTFTAVYGEPEAVSQHQFTVTWKNWDGTTLATQTYTAGQTPSYPNANPSRPDDSEYTYTFSGWTPAITVVSGDVTYTATYTEAKKTYTVTFHANGGIFGSTETQTVSNVTKGTLFRDIFPADPTNSNSNRYFFGWFTAANGGTEIEGTEEFDGTKTNVYAHWYTESWNPVSSIEDGEWYRLIHNNNSYAIGYNGTGLALTRVSTTTSTTNPLTKQVWIAKASSTSGRYFFNSYYAVYEENTNAYIYTGSDYGDTATAETSNADSFVYSNGYLQYGTTGYYLCYDNAKGDYYLSNKSDNRVSFTLYKYVYSDINAGTNSIVNPVQTSESLAPVSTRSIVSNAVIDAGKTAAPASYTSGGDEYRFTGWNSAEDGTGTAPVAATADADYYAQDTKDGVYTYTMYLHAVYGLYNKSGTHVTWFGNNDPTGATAGVQIERDKGMQINIGYDIPKPTEFVNGVKDYAADSTQSTPATTNLTYEDHVFLGWARLEADPNDTANAGSAHPDLTEKDLYLKWDATSGKYYLNTNADGEGDPVWSTELYTKIAADEMTPYHDMYAVWAGFYYIYHSSDGTLEAVQAPFDASETKDIVSEVNNGYLYGGYYKAYRGAQTIEGGEATMKSRINSEVLQSTGFWDYTNSKIADGAINSIDLTAAGAVDYDATTDKIMLDGSLVRLWNKTDAYGKTETGDAWAAVDGRAMTPVVGEIYYLREVPNVYLPNVALAICDDKDENGNVTDQISKVYVLSASDELLYTTTQFSLAGSKVKATVSKQFIVDYREPNPDGNGYTPKTETFTPAELREGLSGKIGWVLSYEIPVADLKTGTGLVVKPSWTTYDGVTVYGDEFTYKISSDGTTLERNQ